MRMVMPLIITSLRVSVCSRRDLKSRSANYELSKQGFFLSIPALVPITLSEFSQEFLAMHSYFRQG
jgi:hypothetical protein